MIELSQQKRWLTKLSVTLWVSFLWASIATMLFFATFDPVEISEAATFPISISRASGYSIGFILFWCLLTINSLAINWLIDSGSDLDSESSEGSDS